MIRHASRAVAAALVGACLGAGAVLGAGSAGATPDDDRFADAVSALKISLAPDTDVPAIGHGVCDLLTSAIKGNVNPIPAVRGVVTELQNRGLERGQAIGLMRVSSGIYCPEYGRYVR